MPSHPFAPARGRCLEISIDSQALASNLLGDPSERRVAVYLPEGYADSTDRYPLFVDLVGFTGSGFSHLNWRAFAESLPQRLDRLVAERKMGPVVLALPDAFTSLGGNQYIDSLAMGAWARFLIEEMLPRLESELRILPGPGNRAVFGKSSGGYGALVHGLRYAEHWGAVACHSGDIDFDLVYRGELPRLCNLLAKHERSVSAFLAHVDRSPKLKEQEMHGLMMLAMAATYDPDPSAPKGIRLPVDVATSALDPIRWEAWLRHDPLRLIDDPVAQRRLASLKGLFLDCGVEDQYHLHYGARQLDRKLEAASIPHRYEEFEDNHSSIDYRMDVSLPFLYAALTGQPPGGAGGY